MNHTVPVAVLNDTRIDRHHGCERVMQALDHLLQTNGCEVVARCPAHRNWEHDAAFLQGLERAQLIVVNGEGTLHHDRPAARQLLNIGRWAHARGLPAVLVNAGWEANSPELSAMLDDFALVAVRDSASAAELATHDRPSRVVPDLSLYAGNAGIPSGQRGAMLFTDSVNRFTALDLEACRQAVGGQTLSIVFPEGGPMGYLAFLRAGIAKSDLPKPQVLLRLLAMRHRLATQANRHTDHFLKALAQGSLLVSGRFHACTLALTTGTPFVAVPSNTGKIAALVADAGLESWRAETDLTTGAILKARELGWSAAERKNIDIHLAHARDQATQLFRDIRSLAA